MNEEKMPRNRANDIFEEGRECGQNEFLDIIRNVMDMCCDEVEECFGGQYETCWDVIDEANAGFITAHYNDWLKKKDAEEAANRREEIVDEAVHDFQKVIPMLIGEMKEIMQANGYKLKAVKVNFNDPVDCKVETRVVYSPA